MGLNKFSYLCFSNAISSTNPAASSGAAPAVLQLPTADVFLPNAVAGYELESDQQTPETPAGLQMPAGQVPVRLARNAERHPRAEAHRGRQGIRPEASSITH